MDIISPQPATIERVFVQWVKSSPSQKLSRLFLNGAEIWNISDVEPPSDIPGEGNWNATSRQMPLGTSRLVLQFQEPLEAGEYSVTIDLDIPCQVSGSFTVP